ncbi:3-hydroxyanthranilate 3,4-dioxygenase isoform X2 [Eurytemora carolleeae]|uniref:3-hydroxyanthranilate 3,4-dioxygenase isoform X2 n=1 Tax=Eurytemora carolleeae TaxID=1294199 RepID=UPI000C785F57|nr:3-hydroxyanthranilate 3,4-dioxygenase isoform X2 [Eurytemora carolleeae]|eukprot:XP_023333784.1 3-hydroxyanthranilate 3,4-dioxygenase-like isoform X2 [Eurytemora affinis]
MSMVHYSTKEWLEKNSKFFLPPVCNKMMHNDQLKVFFVGGPNQRKDFHLEEGEELFYMRKGSMELPILEQGQIRTVKINEGDIFLLPGRIPHSPQRGKDTVGLVIERERLETETDGLRYFVEGSTDILYERWFHCEDLGTQLKPIIDEFFASDEHKTGQPSENSVITSAPWEPNSQRSVPPPFNLQDWLDMNRRLIRSSGELFLFDPKQFQSDVKVLGFGEGQRELLNTTEVFLWQLEGSAVVSLNGQEIRLRREDTLHVPGGSTEHCSTVQYIPTTDSLTLYCHMDPENKNRIEQE